MANGKPSVNLTISRDKGQGQYCVIYPVAKKIINTNVERGEVRGGLNPVYEPRR